MVDAPHPEPDSPSVWVERFLDSKPNASLDEFDAWASSQPSLQESAALLAATRESVEKRLHAAALLRMDDDREEGSVFRRREGGSRAATPDPGGAEELRPGQRIGSFTLRRFIAKGGMGQVWEAEDSELRRRVALKLVLPDRIDETSLALFAREARAGGRLHHPNLVTTLGFGTDDGLTWIAQELVEGSWTIKDSLDAIRAEDAVPKHYYREVAELVARIADGMQAAHDAGVIHRDLKPQNILVANDEQPKVTDFGLARVEDDSFRSQTGDFGGTWAYMSPEQVTAKRMGLDDRTDVFSLGVVLYELLTLRRPFDGDTTHQIATKIIAEDPPEASKVRSQCPRELAVICAKAMEKSPDRRYRSMREFAADLRRHLASEPILAKPAGPWTRGLKWARRHPAISSAAAIASVGLVVVSALSLTLAETASDLREQTQVAQRNERLATDRADELARAARDLREQTRLAEEHAAAESEQRRLAVQRGNELAQQTERLRDALEAESAAVRRSEAHRMVASGRLAGREGKHRLGAVLSAEAFSIEPSEHARSALLAQMAEPQATCIDYSHQGPVVEMTCDADEQTLATAGADGVVILWKTADRSMLQVMCSDSTEVRGLAFCRDGSLLIGHASGMLYRWERGLAAPSSSVELASPSDRDLRGLVGLWTFDGRVFAVADRCVVELDPLTLDVLHRIEELDGLRPLKLRDGPWMGKLLVDCGEGRTVALDPSDWSVLGFPEGELHDCHSSRALALVEVDKTRLDCFVLRSGKWQRRTSIDAKAVSEARFSRDGRAIAMSGVSGLRLMRRTSDGAYVEAQRHDGEPTLSRQCYWSPSGARLIHANEFELRLIDPKRSTPALVLAEHRSYVLRARFLGEDRLVTCGSDGALIWWDLNGRLPLDRFPTDTALDGRRGPLLFSPSASADDWASEELTAVHWSADGHRLAWSSADRASIVDSSASTATPIESPVAGMTADGNAVWSLTREEFKLLSAATGEPLASLRGRFRGRAVQLSASGDLLMLPRFGRIEVVDLEAAEYRRDIEADKSTGGFLDSDLLGDGSGVIAACRSDVRYFPLDATDKDAPARILATGQGFVCATGRSTHVAAAGGVDEILLWRDGIDAPPERFGGYASQLMHLALDERSEQLLSIHVDNVARIWSFDGELRLTIPLRRSMGVRGRFGPSGRWVEIDGGWWPLEPEDLWKVSSPPGFLFRELEQQQVGSEEDRTRRIAEMTLQFLSAATSGIERSTDRDSPASQLRLLAARSGAALRAAEQCGDDAACRESARSLFEALRWLADRPDAGALDWNSLAWCLLDEPLAPADAVPEALRWARKAVTATERQNADILDTLALALFRTGDTGGAIEAQSEALELVRRAAQPDDERIRGFAGRLREYEDAAEGAR